jgi:hypothetical protein
MMGPNSPPRIQNKLHDFPFFGGKSEIPTALNINNNDFVALKIRFSLCPVL